MPLRSLALFSALGFGAGVALDAARRARRIDLAGRVIVVTGGGRGLGHAIARQLVEGGSRLAICGRDAEEIERAAQALRRAGGDVHAAACDCADSEAVARFMDDVIARFGRIDALVNNAGECFVGPAGALRDADVERAMRNIFWAQVRPTLAVLPHMRARRFGRIVHVASIGGKLPLPHQAAYAAGKFALVGWAQSIATELAREGVRVSVVTPPPLRDGAALYAHYQGRRDEELRWFTLALGSPVSIAATRAARAVVAAIAHGDIERSVAWQSWLPARAYGLAPVTVTRALGLFERLLPPQVEPGSERQLGRDVVRASARPLVRRLGEREREHALRFQPLAAREDGPLAVPLAPARSGRSEPRRRLRASRSRRGPGAALRRARPRHRRGSP
jgi:NAD(P)-dependent dehydrogenase (short-subunit alcohol dehydrogenase family)